MRSLNAEEYWNERVTGAVDLAEVGQLGVGA